MRIRIATGRRPPCQGPSIDDSYLYLSTTCLSVSHLLGQFSAEPHMKADDNRDQTDEDPQLGAWSGWKTTGFRAA